MSWAAEAGAGGEAPEGTAALEPQPGAERRPWSTASTTESGRVLDGAQVYIPTTAPKQVTWFSIPDGGLIVMELNVKLEHLPSPNNNAAHVLWL